MYDGWLSAGSVLKHDQVSSEFASGSRRDSTELQLRSTRRGCRGCGGAPACGWKVPAGGDEAEGEWCRAVRAQSVWCRAVRVQRVWCRAVRAPFVGCPPPYNASTSGISAPPSFPPAAPGTYP